MLNPDYNTDKFLYKMKKWGELNQDICLLMYTDHRKGTKYKCPYSFSIFIVVEEYMEFTQKLDWLEFFGKTISYNLTHTGENSIIEVDYEGQLRVKYTVVESSLKESSESCGELKVLINKEKDS
ncbi:hypothetical protein ZORO111903_03570 [Zobellia roscoffensis]